MKKVAKSVALLLVMGMILVLLAGCGSDKLVATKTTEDDMVGSYKEEVVMTFEKDKVTNIEMSMEFDKEETAAEMYSMFNMGLSMSGEDMEGMEAKQDGKKFIMTMDAKAYAESEGVSDEEMTKDAMKAALEADGYTVK